MSEQVDITVKAEGGGLNGQAGAVRLGIARALLRQPDLMIVNQSTASLDSTAQQKVLKGVLGRRKGKGVIWVLHRAGMAGNFDHVIVVRGGRVVEQGSAEELNKEDSALQELIKAE